MTSGIYSSMAGVRANQTRIDVISNNIANVNTLGFKSSDVTFATVFSNTISGGSNPAGVLGGTNPKQLGNGVIISAIPTNFGQGGTQYTGRPSDMMINGEGFFVVERVDQNVGQVNSNFYFTRAGNFTMDSEGNLGTAAGARVRGTSQLVGSSPVTQNTVKIPMSVVFVKDLDATGQIIGTHIGMPPDLNDVNAMTDLRESYEAQATGNLGVDPAVGLPTESQVIQFARLVTYTVEPGGAITASYSNGDRLAIRTDVNTVDPVDPTQARREIYHIAAEGRVFGSDNSSPGNGPPDGLPSLASDDGIVDQINNTFNTTTSVFEVLFDGQGNPEMRGSQFQVQTASVTNPSGLLYDGNNNFLPGANSGETFFGIPSTENRGTIHAGALESSNVDIAGEFTNLIVTQRAVEANSRVIRAHSEVLQFIIQNS